MKIQKKKTIASALLLALLSTMLLSGCMNILAEDLYSLPQLPEEYSRLQSIIDEILEQGAEFSPPITGINRQAVQMRDLDGDGINEIIVFFALPDRGELKVYIFTFEGGNYSIAEIIEVEGIAFESVRYVDMDGNGLAEIVIGRQVSLLSRQMEIFTINDFNAESLIQAEYIDFIDFDMTGDGSRDIVAITPLPQEDGMAVTLYKLMPNGEILMSTATLTGDIQEYVQVLTGRLPDDTPAIFIEREVEVEQGYQIITEIFIFYDDNLISTTLN
jgi:hypothetical protein